MDTESIMKVFAESEFSEDIGNILEVKNIPFEVINGIIRIKLDTVEHSITKNVVWSLINENLKLKGIGREAFMGLRTLRGEAYPKDFLKPDISVLDLSEGGCGSNGMYVGIPDLIVEVALEDRRVSYQKRFVYQEMGIPEYWVVDLLHGGITQFILENGSYGSVSTLYTGEIIKHHRCGIELDVEKAFELLRQKLKVLNKTLDEEPMEDREHCQCNKNDERICSREQTEEEIRELKDKLQKMLEENVEIKKRILFLEEEVAKIRKE